MPTISDASFRPSSSSCCTLASSASVARSCSVVVALACSARFARATSASRPSFSASSWPRVFASVDAVEVETRRARPGGAKADDGFRAPDFGTAASGPAVWQAFYNHFEGFATTLTFAWLDKWDLREAPNRRVRRAMEKENKAERKKGIRDYNDRVRSLAAFCRRRDQRALSHAAAKKEAASARAEERAASAAKAKAEDGRVAGRNLRGTAKQALEKLEKDGEVGKDDVTGAEKKLDSITKKHTDAIDEMLKNKEAELLEV